jgi:hypothetical protein
MVVTASLARGAVRAAAVRHSEASEREFRRLKEVGVRAPATLRGYREWFRNYSAMLQRDALLIVCGNIGRRKGALSAYKPSFQETDQGWNLGICELRIEFLPGQIELIDVRRLPVTISGHALERMFQRLNTIDWPVIRGCLASAALFVNAVASACLASGASQCAVPADEGLLVGQTGEDALALRTFLPASQLNPRWQSLYDGLRAFAADNSEAIRAAGLVPDEGLMRSFGEFLKRADLAWLRRPYVPGEDPLEDAWRSRASGGNDSVSGAGLPASAVPVDA